MTGIAASGCIAGVGGEVGVVVRVGACDGGLSVPRGAREGWVIAVSGCKRCSEKVTTSEYSVHRTQTKPRHMKS